ncbi:MAG: hypothetical protein ACKVHO_11335 [Verrucomicrobiia bacterium]
MLLKVALSFAIARGDQDDLVPEILLQLWQSLDRFAGQSKPSSDSVSERPLVRPK